MSWETKYCFLPRVISSYWPIRFNDSCYCDFIMILQLAYVMHVNKPKTERNLFIELLGETHWMTLPDTIVTTRVRYFTTGGPGKEHRTDKPLPTGRVWERSKGDTTFPTDFPEASSLESILAEQCVQLQEGPWVRMTGQRQPGNPSYHHKTWDCKPRGRAVLLGSSSLTRSWRCDVEHDGHGHCSYWGYHSTWNHYQPIILRLHLHKWLWLLSPSYS